MRRIFIIVGMHRSGTSLTAQLCQCMGAYLGEEHDLIAAASENPDGHFENLQIVQINNEILRLCNRDWYSLEKPELDDSAPQIKNAAENIKTVIQKLLEKNDTVSVKDPRISVVLPLWDRVLKELNVEAHYIWVYRNPLEVAESLRKRNGYSKKHSMLLWMHYNLCILSCLQGKEYLLIHYRDILERPQTLEKLSGFLACDVDAGAKLDGIIKYGYCHSKYTCQDVKNTQNTLLADLYNVLLKNQETEADVLQWEASYKSLIAKTENKYFDREVLENPECLKEKEIIIYGAGNYGKKAAMMVRQLGISKYNFCDKDIHKQGMRLLDGRIKSIAEIENKRNLLVIIAMENKQAIKEIEETLSYIEEVRVLSFFALKTIREYIN